MLSTGKVAYLLVSPTLCKVQILDQTDNRDEVFVAWNSIPADVSDRIVHGMYVSMLRDALSKGLKVTIEHDEKGSIIKSLKLLA